MTQAAKFSSQDSDVGSGLCFWTAAKTFKDKKMSSKKVVNTVSAQRRARRKKGEKVLVA